MGIDALNNTYGVPDIKNERETVMNQRKKQRKQQDDKKREEREERIENEGKVDIRI
ncbi:MAG: hypothetical protein HY757_06030 [Nitrospirae bacterium]|nr:hypothetical protein [Nitrospirota bacterium]